MTLVINTAHARPDGVHVVNLGTPSETEVSLAPEAEDANAQALLSWFRDGNKAHSWEPDLADMKAHALDVARKSASAYRRQIADHVPDDQFIAWVLKAAFGSIWLLHEQNPSLADSELAMVAQAGFAAEAEITSEDAKELRDRSLARSELLFQAVGIVDGMRRLAEARIPAATTPQELDAIVSGLRAKEATAKAKLEALKT